MTEHGFEFDDAKDIEYRRAALRRFARDLRSKQVWADLPNRREEMIELAASYMERIADGEDPSVVILGTNTHKKSLRDRMVTLRVQTLMRLGFSRKRAERETAEHHGIKYKKNNPIRDITKRSGEFRKP